MVKHTQTIRLQQPMNCLSVFDHFVGLALKGLILEAKCSDIFFSQFFHTSFIYLKSIHYKTYQLKILNFNIHPRLIADTGSTDRFFEKRAFCTTYTDVILTTSNENIFLKTRGTAYESRP